MKSTGLILLILAISAVSATFISCSDDDEITIEVVWDGRLPQPQDADYAFGGGSGTESDPYCISSSLHLAQLAANVNGGVSNYSGKYFRQTGDINLENHEWTPIGIGAGILFSGQYDGGGFAISGLSITQWGGNNVGLFGCVQEAVLKNINLEGTIALSDKDELTVLSNSNMDYLRSYCGSVCGMAQNTVIENCTYDGSIDTDAAEYSVGGICGGMLEEGSFGNCENRADLKAGTAGGIVGYMSGYAIVIANCYNSGTVRGSRYAGGILGESSFEYSWEEGIFSLTITCCRNTGNIYSSMCAGGLGGLVTCDDSSSRVETLFILVKGCCNTAPVTIEYRNQLPLLGGLFGYTLNTHLIACYNTGILTTDGPAAKVTTGGLVGLLVFCNAFTSCYRAGDIDELERGAMIGELSNLEPYGTEYKDCWTSKYLSEADEKNLSLFGADAWPQECEYWRSVGGWNNGNPVYPQLWWENK